MSTALIAALRESCDYLRDSDYHQTADLMAMAADEIERLKHRLQTLETASEPARQPARNSTRRLRAKPPAARPASAVAGQHRR